MKYITRNDLGLKNRSEKSHKGDNGRVLIIAGSIDYPGAAVMAGNAAVAALYSCSDLVTIAAPERVAWVINTISPEIITKKIRCNYFMNKNSKEVLQLSEKADVVAIGPGLGRRATTGEFVKKILRIEKPKVIDADALYLVDLRQIKNSILTPHAGEFEALLRNNKLNEKNIPKNLKNNVILLKGPIDKIITKDKIYYNKTGNAGMTKAGTGDVLTGLTAGLLAQGNYLETSAKASAYINGLAGDNLKKKQGYSYLASDLIREITRIRKEF